MAIEQNFHRPVDIDEPFMLFFWEFTEFLIGICLVVVGILMQSGFGFVLFGCGGFYYLLHAKRASEAAKRGEYLHRYWVMGIRNDKLLKIYPFGIKNFSGKF